MNSPRHTTLGRAGSALIATCRWTAVWTLAIGLAPTARADADSLCGPFDQPYQLAQANLDGAAHEKAGVSTAKNGRGSIVDLSKLVTPASAGRAADQSEALLALAKNDAGEIPTGFELGVGARISSSFFSPVLCATLARVTGPAGATLEQLVTIVPEGSTVVPNDIYLSAAEELRPIEGEAESKGEPIGRVQSVGQPDPYVSLQYGLAISGVREARELSAGGGVKIALLDSAPDVKHRDLSSNSVRSISGSDAASRPGVHGTLMAGVISAVEGNGFGIMGLAPDAELISIPVCTPAGRAGGSCTIFDLLKGLDQAWDAEVDLVNLSLSGPANSLLERGVARLEELGVVVVAAAGNEGSKEKHYPAAYPTVIGVGSIDRDGRLSPASNRGDWVEILAPGVEVLSTIPGDAFAFGNGTSLAAAHVTGALAVLTAATGNAKTARAEFFRTVAAPGRGPKHLPRVCDVLARLDLSCSADGLATER
jgi:subtilisin family serine protease